MPTLLLFDDDGDDGPDDTGGGLDPLPTTLRFAVTSRDGISVNERLHRAVDFFVFERRGDAVAFVERRERVTSPARQGRIDRDYSSLATLLGDCGFVISLGFNGEARKELTARGFRLLETRGPIEGVIRGLPLDTFPSRAP